MNAETEKSTSAEEKFLGVKTTIGEPDNEDAPKVEIEVEGEETSAAADKPDAAADKSLDDEMDQYTEGVQKRINKMTWEKNEEKRRADAAEAQREEAVSFAQQVLQKNQKYENIIREGEGRLVSEINERARLAVEQAQSKYSKAYEEGDTDAIVAAQSELIQAQQQHTEALRYNENYQYRQQHPVPPQPPAMPRRNPNVVPRPTERAANWAKNNQWFGSNEHKDMTALAYGVHETLVKEQGVQVDSDEYYKGLDAAMRQRFPEFFDAGKANGQGTSTASDTPTVVASGERNDGVKPSKVKLTSTQVAIAKRLGVSMEDYAKQLIKEH